MPITGIDHVQLAMPVGSEQAARDFYEGILGIPEVPKPPKLAARGGVWFEQCGVKVHLGVEADFRPARKAHPGLLVTGLAALVERLKAHGARVIDDDPLEGYVRIYVDDPFGNRLELLEAKSAPERSLR
jgi:catechol 2,3-dioxygenase-like lactoylglutathione lyase family enzyme